VVQQLPLFAQCSTCNTTACQLACQELYPRGMAWLQVVTLPSGPAGKGPVGPDNNLGLQAQLLAQAESQASEAETAKPVSRSSCLVAADTLHSHRYFAW
jgi:hypothetical protein